MSNKPIGIFDSGAGGLTVLRAVTNLLPNENIVYFGDTARVPYGNKSKAAIIKFSSQCIGFLRSKKVKAIVVACNTSSALALSVLRKTSKIPMLGVIEAGVNSALKTTRNKKIGVIGTRSTIKSKSYQKLIRNKDKNIRVYSQSCPLFVPLAEEGFLNSKLTHQAITIYLKNIKSKSIDTIILGCTHYPLLKRQISSYLKGVAVIDSADAVARYTKDLLKRKGLLSQRNANGKIMFYVSDEPQGFAKLAKLFLKRNIPNPKMQNV